MSDFQIGLLVLGVLVLLALLLQSLWTARANAPRQAQDEVPEAEGTPAFTEPVFDDTGFTNLKKALAAPRRPAIDDLIDAVAAVNLDPLVSAVSGDAAVAAFPGSWRVGSKPFLIEGFNADAQEWETPVAGARYMAFQTAVQLANRAGALNEIEYSEFVVKTQAFADAVNGTPEFREMRDEVARARELDHFASEQDAQALLASLNQEHAATREGDQRLEARIKSYELAARMQLAAPDALNLKAEPEHVLKLYGLDGGPKTWPAEINADEEAWHFSQKCLTARRLLERGVRFVQIWSGNDNSFPRRNWDSHEDIRRDHGPLSNGMARGTAALIADLKQRGMLDDTIILWTTEFGRMPSSQGGKGRDHNPFVFTNWLCGGGIKGGTIVGESDQWGYKPLVRNNPTTVYDIHATILHLLGIDHTKLTVRNNGIDRRLTDVHGHVIAPLLA